MAEKDINGMRAQNWTAKDTSLTEKARDNNKSKVTDSKLSKLYEALTEVIITSVKDSYGKNSDKKYIYQTDMLMSRVRKALTEKLSDLQIDSIKQLVIDNTKQQDVLISKMLLNAFSTLSVKIDKNAQAKLVEKIAVVVDKLLKSYVAKDQSSKSNSKSKKKNDKLTEIVSALKSSSKSQATHKVKEAEIKQYQSKAYKLISKTLVAVNQNHTIAIQSMTAGFKHTTETISNEVSSLQENIEDANSGSSIMSLIPQLKNASAIAKFANPMSWFKLFVVKPMKLLFSGLWNFLLKPMFYVGKFLLKPIGYLVKGIWDNFIKKPIAKLIELTGTVLGAVTSAATTALSVFFLTPKGAYILGYAVGYVWSRWIKPIITPILKFANKHILPLLKSIAKWSFKKIEDLMHYVGQPLLKMLNGDETFNEAMKEIMFKWVLGDDIYKKDENGNKIKQTDDKGNVLLQKDGITPKYAMKDWSSLIYDSVIKALKAFLDLKVPGLNWSFDAFGKKFTIGTIRHWMYVLAAIQVLNAGAQAINAFANLAKITKYGTKIFRHKSAQTIAEKTTTAIKKGAVKTAEKTAIASMTKKELIKELQNSGSTMSANQLKKQSVKQLRKAVEREAEKKITKTTTELAAKKGGVAVGKTVGKSVLKKIPLIGLVAGAGFAIQSAMNGDWTGAGLELASGAASLLPGVGTAASIAIDVANGAREINNVLNSAKNAAELISDDIDITKNATKNTLYEVTANIDTTKTEQIVAEQQAKIDNLLSDMLKPLGTATYIVNTKNDELERAKSNLLKEESAKQIGQIARDTSKKAAEQSAQLTAKEYKNVLDAALGAYDLKTTKSSLADNMKLSQTMLKDVSDNQEEFLKRMDKLQTTLEQMFISKGKSQDEAKQASYFFINSFKDKYAPMSNKDRYTTDYITSGDY